MKRQVWVDRWDDPALTAPKVESPVKLEPPKGLQTVDQGKNNSPEPSKVEITTKTENMKRQKWVESWDGPKAATQDENPVKLDKPKRQKWVDRWDEPKKVPVEDPVRKDETERQRWADGLDAINQKDEQEKPKRRVWVDRWDIRESGAQTDNIVARIRGDLPGHSTESPRSNEVQPRVKAPEQNAQLGKQTTPSPFSKGPIDEEGGTTFKPPEASSYNHVSTGIPKRTGTQSSIHLDQAPDPKTYRTRAQQDNDQSQKSLPKNDGSSPKEGTPKLRGLQHSRWAQAAVAEASPNGYHTPTKVNTQPRQPTTITTPFKYIGRTPPQYTSSMKASQSVSTRGASGTAPTLDVSIPLALASGLADEQNRQMKAATQDIPKEAKATLPLPNVKQEPIGTNKTDSNVNTTAAPLHESRQRAHLPEHLTKDGKPAAARSSPRVPSVLIPRDPNTPYTKVGSQSGDKPGWSGSASKASDSQAAEAVIATQFVSRDPRGEFPVELDMEQDWNETRRPKPMKQWDTTSLHSDDVFVLTHATRRFLEWWAAGIPDVKANFLEQCIQRHQDCDVDAVTGLLMKPIEYEETHRPLDVNPIQFNRTTFDVINLALYEYEIRGIKITQKKEKREKVEQQVAIQRQEEFVHPFQVQADCHLRPATEDDMEGVAAIYNHEVEQSYKVFDTQPVSIQHFHTLLKACQAQKRPFIVAAEGRHNSEHGTSRQRILGFCLVDALQRGIAGSYVTSAERCGKVTVVVHPDWRQKRIGTALIDVILYCCSNQYPPKGGYQWVCDPDDLTHTEPAYNPRRWCILQMDVLVKSGPTKRAVQNSAEYQWIFEFLEAKFNLQLLKHDQYVCFVSQKPMIHNQWLDRLVFEHRCRQYGT